MSLRKSGLAAQIDRGRYTLGDEFLRLALQHLAERPESTRVAPTLESLAERFGETAHYAVLDDTDVVYRAKKDPLRGAVRLTSVVGGRNPAHCTALGKMLLSEQTSSKEELVALLGDGPYERRTEKTITSATSLWRELCVTRDRGFAIEDEESERGINCVALPVRFGPDKVAEGAISLSCLTFRMPLAVMLDAVPTIREAVQRLSLEWGNDR